MSTSTAPRAGVLSELAPGQAIVYGGNRVATVSDELAAAFRSGDRLVVDPSSGSLLHVPEAEHAVATGAVTAAVEAFAGLAHNTDDQITDFFERFADLLEADESFAPIAAANAADVEQAAARNRSTTRLVLGDAMRRDMVAGLRAWAELDAGRDLLERHVEHDGWTLEARRAPLGVVGFVFEGRPNVFADAAGVVRTGNTVVFRIGSDALGTAQAIVRHALEPALVAAGLPAGTISLVTSAAHAAGWALFSDERLSLAVARGSGPAVAQLGAVARHAGVPVSLHGTGGAWVVADETADTARFASTVTHSLDRKVCNTLNVCCIVRERAAELVPAFLGAVTAAGEQRGADGRVHVTEAAGPYVPDGDRSRRSAVVRADGTHDEPFVSTIDVESLGHEWEWEGSPEATLHVVDDAAEAVRLCNEYSPHFVASLVSESADAHERFWSTVDAPFVGDGFTRWVDGQYALRTPELGLSNWEGGRMLGRGGVLSGDSVFTIRYRARVADADLHR
ncbi:MAG: aldehyde dehydrogenase family protein [Ilumatobacter sp.]|uniref:aldehyde dehydrogenase family protein n=1 Tax=Ilumatobacter sp. TaxID=1967498 RepID=UPI00261C4C44|nr:aldehyde dehydrogenase family protein [Ilumatobacter sp.]MDJ0767488.1 aldehyde dehydrogenase family protein [Ilumatobacter sp.]